MNRLLRSVSLATMAILFAGTGVMAQAFEGPEFDAAVRRYIEQNPQVIIDSINAHVESQREAEAAQADDAFLSSMAMFGDASGLPVVGNPDGTVTMYYVLDAACTYCRQMEPVLEQLMADNPDLKIVQRWVPFLTPASEYGARLAFLVSERFPDKYHDFYAKLMTQTGQLSNDVVDAVLRETVGEDAWQLLRNDATDGAEGLRVAGLVQNNLETASAAGVTGTPFFYVDQAGRDGIVRGASPAQVLQAAIDKVRATQ